MNDELLSIMAISQCMEDLGIDRRKKPLHTIEAQMYNFENHSSGNIIVTFNCNWQSGDGPYIEVDDVIRGYGIKYKSFKPQWQIFSYNKDEKQLLITGDDYRFSLTFRT